jgi:hypothetical protein
MSDVTTDTHGVRTDALSATSIQTYARIAGALFLVTIFAGGFGEFYVPSKLIVSRDATVTASNVIAHGSLFRWGFAAYLVEATCDIGLSLLFYVLLRPVHRNLALLSAFFGLVSTAVFAGAELFYFAPTFILGGSEYLNTFSPAQLNTLGLLSLKLYVYGAGIFMTFYGTACAIRGYLIYRSTFLPRILGALMMLAGLGFILKNFLLVLAPAYSSDFFVLPMSLVAIAMTIWVLVKGVHVARWQVASAGAGEQP